MTRQELSDLYNALYYGHEAELEICDQHYFIEWGGSSVDIYKVSEGCGEKIVTFSSDQRSEILLKIFAFNFDGCNNLNDDYRNISIIDIE